MRSTNYGIYLFTYSILSLLGYILLVIAQVLQYYPNQLTGNSKQNEGLDSDAFFYLCIWLRSLIAFERGLIIYSASEMNAPQWRPFVAIGITYRIYRLSAAFALGFPL
jgi:hypothetical protein